MFWGFYLTKLFEQEKLDFEGNSVLPLGPSPRLYFSIQSDYILKDEEIWH